MPSSLKVVPKTHFYNNLIINNLLQVLHGVQPGFQTIKYD